MSSHLIVSSFSRDIASKIMAFSQQGPRTICILSANGAICNVTLRQPAMSGGSVIYKVVTTPMPSINTIAVEAFKKYILVSLIQNRLFSSSLPKYTSSAAQRNFENLVSDQDGEIHAKINQKDGMVRFLEDPEQYKNSEMIERIDS